MNMQVAGNNWPAVHRRTATVRMPRLSANYDVPEGNLTVFEHGISRSVIDMFESEIPWYSEMPITLNVPRYRDIAINDTPEEHPPSFLPNASFEKRVVELRAIAQDEELALSDASLDRAKRFLAGLCNTTLPGVFLVGNGNIRLVWDRHGERVGLQFLDDGRVQFLFLQNLNGQISSLMGIRPASHILQLIDQNRLRPIMMS